MKKTSKKLVTVVLTFVLIFVLSVSAFAAGNKVNKKAVKKSSVCTMQLWRDAVKNNWTATWTEEQKKGKITTVITFKNSSYTMKVTQIVYMKGKKAVVKYYQGDQEIAGRKGIKRTLKKYSVAK